MEYFGKTDIGKVRKENQDDFAIREDTERRLVAAVVCDGMGGAKAGGLASNLGTKTFMDYLDSHLFNSPLKRPSYSNIISTACAEANGIVYQYSCFDSDFNGMGTTLVGALIKKDQAYIVNVGDSRAYLVGKKAIQQITLDHSLVAEMVRRGELTEEQAKNHPRKNIITNALGIEGEIQSDVFHTKLHKGDRLLLCSDGITNIISDSELLGYSQIYESAEESVNHLMKVALDRGAPDNITAVAVTI